MILNAQPGIEVVGEAADGHQAVELARRLRPDVCLFDIRMPGLDGIEATRALAGPTVADPLAVVVITTFDLDEYVYAALRAGARGFLLKDAGPALLAQAVHAAANGDALIAPSITARLLEAFADAGSGRSAGAADRAAHRRARSRSSSAVARGRTNNEIADELYITLSTVKTHIASLMAKLGARNRVEIAMWAYEHGRVQPADRPPKVRAAARTIERLSSGLSSDEAGLAPPRRSTRDLFPHDAGGSCRPPWPCSRAVPATAGVLRLTELASGAAATPENARFVTAPLPVVIHIVAAVVYCLLGAVQFTTAPNRATPAMVRRRRRGWHRAAGRIVVVCGLATALSGLWMTLFYRLPAIDGELLWGFRLVFGSGMAVSIGLGFAAIRRRDVAHHRAWMIRGYAIGQGAGTQVFTSVPPLLLFGPPDEFGRAMSMLAGWVINLAVAEWIIRRRPRPLGDHHAKDPDRGHRQGEEQLDDDREAHRLQRGHGGRPGQRRFGQPDQFGQEHAEDETQEEADHRHHEEADDGQYPAKHK